MLHGRGNATSALCDSKWNPDGRCMVTWISDRILQVVPMSADAVHRRGSLATVVIVNCNYEKFVAAAIDSALEQAYQPLEVIVVDDGSTDGSRRIISAYGEGIRTSFQTNSGQGGGSAGRVRAVPRFRRCPDERRHDQDRCRVSAQRCRESAILSAASRPRSESARPSPAELQLYPHRAARSDRQLRLLRQPPCQRQCVSKA